MTYKVLKRPQTCWI